MLVAVCDQPLGTSTSSWRKIVLPFSLPISATRRSHSTASNGEVRPSVKYRSNSRPVRTSTSSGVVAPVCRVVFWFKAIFVCDIIASAQVGSPAQREPLYFTPEMLGLGAGSSLILSRPPLDSILSARNSRAFFYGLKFSLDAFRVKVESAPEKR